MNVVRGVALAPPELRQYLLPRIAAYRRIAVHLPPHPELLLGIEIDLHVVAIAHGARGKAEQAFGDDETLGPHIFGGLERAMTMVVNRLKHRLAAAQQAQMLLQDVDIVRTRV